MIFLLPSSDWALYLLLLYFFMVVSSNDRKTFFSHSNLENCVQFLLSFQNYILEELFM